VWRREIVVRDKEEPIRNLLHCCIESLVRFRLRATACLVWEWSYVYFAGINMDKYCAVVWGHLEFVT